MPAAEPAPGEDENGFLNTTEDLMGLNIAFKIVWKIFRYTAHRKRLQEREKHGNIFSKEIQNYLGKPLDRSSGYCRTRAQDRYERR